MRPVSGGTDTHLALLDLRTAGVDGLTGAEAETRCDAARITLNKNAIPYDPQPPMVGVRHPGRHASGHDAGHDGAEMKEVASLIGRAVRDADGSAAAEVAEAVGVPRRRPPGVPDAGLADGGACASTCSPWSWPRRSPTCSPRSRAGSRCAGAP